MSSVNIARDSDGNEFEFRPISCPTCSTSSERFLGMRGGRYHRYGQGVETRIVQCAQCGLLYPNPFPFPKNAQKLYGDPDKYFANHVSDEKVENNRSILARAKKLAPRPPRTLLDVGSGRGEMLLAAPRRDSPFPTHSIVSAGNRLGLAQIARNARPR